MLNLCKAKMERAKLSSVGSDFSFECDVNGGLIDACHKY